MKLLFAADFHGNRYAYENFFKLATQRNIETLVFGGDLTPKNVAIQLADVYDDREKGGREVLPLDQLQNSSHRTYTDALVSIQRWNQRQGEEKCLHECKQEGYILRHEDNAFYNLQCMIDDYRVLDKLLAFVNASSVHDKNSIADTLTEEDLIVLECFSGHLKEAEKKFDTNEKKAIAQIWTSKFLSKSPRSYTFEELAPSNRIHRYFSQRKMLRELHQQYKSLDTLLAKNKHEKVATWFRDRLNALIEDVYITQQVVELYAPSQFANLADHLPLHQLVKEATSHDKIVAGQRDFLQNYLASQMQSHLSQHTQTNIYAILGNDDVIEGEEDLRHLHSQRLTSYLNTSVAQHSSGLFIAGYPYVKSSQGQYYAAWEKTEEEIAADLEQLAQQSDPIKTIYVIHTPPYNTALDITFDGTHIGSEAVCTFIEKHQPHLVLSGHVHESYVQSGTIQHKIGKTLCYNPGGRHTRKELCAVSIDVEHPEHYERILEVR